MSLLRLTMVLMLLPVMAQAADFTVAPGQSIAAVVSQMRAGDTVTISGGTYDVANIRPPSGVTIQGAPGQTVVLRGADSATGAFYFGSSQVTIRNLTITGGKNGIWIEGSDNTIQDVTITNPRSQGVTLFCASGNHQGCGHGGNMLINVHASGAGMGGCIAGSSGGDGLCHGVYAYSDDNVIVGGEFDHNNGFGIQTYGNTTQVRDVFLHDNVAGGMVASAQGTQVANSIVTSNGSQGGVFIAWGSATLTDLSLTNNAGPNLNRGPNAGQVSTSNVGDSGASLVPGQGSTSASIPPIPQAPTVTPEALAQAAAQAQEEAQRRIAAHRGTAPPRPERGPRPRLT